MLVTKKKQFLEKFDTQIKMPANLNVQVWDNDALSADDFLGKNNTNQLSLIYLLGKAKLIIIAITLCKEPSKNSEHKLSIFRINYH